MQKQALALKLGWWAGGLFWAALTSHQALAQGPPDILWVKGGHVGVNEVALSPDRQTLASAGADDESIKLWRAGDAVMIRTLASHLATVESVAFSPDGQFVASGGDVNFGSGNIPLKLWRVSDGTLVRTFSDGSIADDQTAWSVTFSPDGALLGVGRGYDIQLWRVSDGALLRTLTGHGGYVFSVDFSPDGTLIASGSADNTAKIWRVSDGALQRTLTGHTFFVAGVAFSPNGANLVTGSWDQTAKIWKVSNGQLQKTLTGHTDAIYSVDWSPDGALVASGSGDSTIKLWNPTSGSLVRTLSNPDVLYIQSVQFASDSQTIVSGGSDSKCRQWQVSTGAMLQTFGTHTDRVFGVAYSPDGHFISGSGDTTAKLWDGPTGNLLHDLRGHRDIINVVALTLDNQTAATAAGSPPPDTIDHSVKLWRVSDGVLLRTLPGHPGGSKAADFSSDGTLLATGGSDTTAGLVRLWRVSDGEQIRTFSHTFAVGAVRFSKDGQTLVSASGTVLTWWRVSDGFKIRTVDTATAQINTIAFSPDGTTFATSEEGLFNNVKLWRFSDGALLRTFAGHANAAQGLRSRPTGWSWFRAGDSTARSGSGASPTGRC
ncbi:MAG: hypothetical protein DMF49_09225 [Acidobacteria bacterium]|nr:MAG: hypothetical protein DMF49_09225 [Acidobacteriota bacterium]